MVHDLRRYLAVLAVLPFFAVAACGGSSEEGDEGEGEGNGDQPCTSELAPPADPSAALPADFPTDADAVYFQKETEGETTVYFAYVDGDDVVETRDGIKDAFEAKDFEIEGDDAEENFEAEFEFAGPSRGSIQVLHLCEGKLRIRYRVEG